MMCYYFLHRKSY